MDMCVSVSVCVDMVGGLAELTGDTADDTDPDEPHSGGSHSLSQKVHTLIHCQLLLHHERFGLLLRHEHCQTVPLFQCLIPPPQPFYGPFSGTTRVSWCQKRTSGLYGAKED